MTVQLTYLLYISLIHENPLLIPEGLNQSDFIDIRYALNTTIEEIDLHLKHDQNITPETALENIKNTLQEKLQETPLDESSLENLASIIQKLSYIQ